jgi:MerR family redox-sensitive transcriptional activator SoxR
MIRRVSLILLAKRLGIPLAEVADVFATLPMSSLPTSRDWHRLSRRWQSQLETKSRLWLPVDESCRLLNPDDALA